MAETERSAMNNRIRKRERRRRRRELILLLVDAQQTSVTEMANRILHNALNPGSRPLTDTEVYGVTKQQEATDGH